jgi:hypothetical protein
MRCPNATRSSAYGRRMRPRKRDDLVKRCLLTVINARMKEK